MAILLPYQPYLCQELPIVHGNVDYQIFKDTLERIDELIRLSGIEIRIMAYFVEEAEKEEMKIKQIPEEKYTGLSEKRQRTIQIRARQAQRCMIIKELLDEGFRSLSARLADSPLLQRFCDLIVINIVKVPSKSTLERYEKMFPEKLIKECVIDLIKAASMPIEFETVKQKLLLEKEIKMADYYLDTTCVKANIHFPVDWVLLRDGTRTLMKAITLIRKQGIKHRMDAPSKYIKEMNKLCIKMSNARRAKGSKKKRKKIFRDMKKLIKKISKHGQRYLDLLKTRWNETELTKNEAWRIIERMENVIEKIPKAVWQAHERIIGERKVRNKDKILSLYEDNIHVPDVLNRKFP